MESLHVAAQCLEAVAWGRGEVAQGVGVIDHVKLPSNDASGRCPALAAGNFARKKEIFDPLPGEALDAHGQENTS